MGVPGDRWRRLAWNKGENALVAMNYRSSISGKVVVDPRLLTIANYETITIPGPEYQALRLPSGKTFSCDSNGTFGRDWITGRIDYLTKYYTLWDSAYEEDEYGNVSQSHDAGYDKAYGCVLKRPDRNSPWYVVSADEGVKLVTEQGESSTDEIAINDEDFPVGKDVVVNQR